MKKTFVFLFANLLALNSLSIPAFAEPIEESVERS